MKRARLVLVALMISISLSGCEFGKEGKGTPVPGANGTPGIQIGAAGWIVPGLADPRVPALLEKSSDGTGASRIKPGWEISAIEYVDAWWGLGEPGLHDLTIKRDGAGYKLDGSPARTEDVQALVKSLDHLYPAQMLMQGHAWTDDYPSWAVELVGTDGQHILLRASSTGIPGNGPWNVLYNGLLFAQYDGSVAKPLGQLFGGRLGKDDNPFPNSVPA